MSRIVQQKKKEFPADRNEHRMRVDKWTSFNVCKI